MHEQNLTGLFEASREIPRPPKALVESLSRLPTANLSDAFASLSAMDSGIKALSGAGRLCGPACTVKTRGADFLSILAGLNAARAGDVLVIDCQGRPDMAAWGEITTAEARYKGIVGLVVDGMVRDIDGIRKAEFCVFARGVTPRVLGRSALGEVNVPVQCGGAVVAPGDIIVGDSDGVVVAPRGKAEEILRLAQDIVRFEETLLSKVQGGLSQYEFFCLKEQFESLSAAHVKGHEEFR